MSIATLKTLIEADATALDTLQAAIDAELAELPPPNLDPSGTPDFWRGPGLAKRVLNELKLGFERTRAGRAESLRAITKLEGATQ